MHSQRQTVPGLSPRGRGNRTWRACRRSWLGSIPAWAGEPRIVTAFYFRPEVYPRVGGGTGFAPGVCRRDGGLSPRGRGNPRCYRPGALGRRSIPAWAGEPVPGDKLGGMYKVYPRVGRGNQLVIADTGSDKRSIPAWAGEPTSSSPGGTPSAVYPRVGGGTAPTVTEIDAGIGLSPRGRGNPHFENISGV